MSGRYVKSVGTYLPLLRFERKAAASALAWSGLSGPRSGYRSVAGWDEDALTMAVEAARAGAAGASPRALVFASTSAPFRERLQAAILVESLGLPATTAASDVAGSRRCGVAALRSALLAGDGDGDVLVAAGEARPAAAGSAAQLAWGDGAAAALVGDEGAARLVGEATLSADFVDVYAAAGSRRPYPAEERFVRDEAVSGILAPAVSAALSSAGVAASDIALAVVHEPVPGCYKALASAVGLRAPNLAERIVAAAGDLGAAHPLFGLALALEEAKPGDRILVAGFGSGCDALVFEAGAEPGANGATRSLAHGVALANYARFLSLADRWSWNGDRARNLTRRFRPPYWRATAVTCTASSAVATRAATCSFRRRAYRFRRQRTDPRTSPM
jgi:3-hydroxy-3-methylglutaryl CoA synthase